MNSSPAGPSNQRQYPYAPPSQGLALPGPRMNAEPSNLNMGNGAGNSAYGQREDVRVKSEVDDVLRVRGGMVSLP